MFAWRIQLLAKKDSVPYHGVVSKQKERRCTLNSDVYLVLKEVVA